MENKENVIVPSYMKNKEKESDVKNEKGTDKNKHKKKKLKLNKRFYILIASIIIGIALIFGIIFLVRVIKYSKYDNYCKEMDNYGLSEFFNNGNSTSFEKVTKSEAIKIIITSILNIEDLDKMILVEQEYENQVWIDYAVELGIIAEDEINKSSANNKITYIEYITYFQNARKVLLNATLDTSVYPNFSDISSIQSEQLYALSEMVSQNLIENSNDKIKPNRNLYKGEFCKITLEIIENYNIIVPNGKKLAINKDKMPSNAEQYPYILFDVAKETYEKPFIVNNEEKFKNPNEVYKNVRTNAINIMNIVESYYNAILNIDYETVNKDELLVVLTDNGLFEVDEDILDEYIEYAKQYKIKLSGSAVTQMPILYHDGNNYRLRTKISFEILNSDTKDNILYFDSQNDNYKITYESKKYEFYIDAVIDTATNKSKMMYVWENDVYSQKIDESIEGITTTEIEEEILEID